MQDDDEIDAADIAQADAAMAEETKEAAANV